MSQNGSVDTDGTLRPPDDYNPLNDNITSRFRVWLVQTVLGKSIIKWLLSLRTSNDGEPGSTPEFLDAVGVKPSGGETTITQNNTSLNPIWNQYEIKIRPTNGPINVNLLPIAQYVNTFKVTLIHNGIPNQDGEEQDVTITPAPNEQLNFVANKVLTLDHRPQLFNLYKVGNSWVTDPDVGGQAPVYKSNDHLDNTAQELEDFRDSVASSLGFIGWAKQVGANLIGRRISISNLAQGILPVQELAVITPPDLTPNHALSEPFATDRRYKFAQVKLKAKRAIFNYQEGDIVDFVCRDTFSNLTPPLLTLSESSGSVFFKGRLMVLNNTSNILANVSANDFDVVVLARAYAYEGD